MTDTPRKTPQVVVACAWYNRADYIRDTVDSLLAQDFDDFEIVIVNDGSPDPRVREILDSYDDDRLRVIHQENTGFVGAITRAIAASDAPFIAIQGSGEVSLVSRLSNQWKFLKNNTDHVAVSSRATNVLVKHDGSKQVVNQTDTTKYITVEMLLESNRMVHGAAMIRRETYEAVAGYRKIFKYAQDYDLWLRVVSIGNLSVLDTFDVERNIFESDGIAADPWRIVTQIRLACFARNCAIEVRRSGIDLVEKFGDQATLFIRPDKNVSKRTAASYLKLLMANPALAPEMLAQHAWRDNKNFMSFVVRLISLSSWSRGLTSKILHFILKKKR